MNIVKLKSLVDSVLIEFEREYDSIKHGQISVAPLQQLKKFESNILLIKNDLEQGKFNKYKFYMSRIIVDSWPFNSKLGSLIIELETEYEKFK